MTLKEALLEKAAEVFDLRTRGLLTEIHKYVWEDVLDITERYHDVININVFALTNKCQVRFWSQNGVTWEVAIRPQIKAYPAVILKGNSYEETECKARHYIAKYSKGWKIKETKELLK